MSLTFLHPHIETQVIDNSFVFETADGGGTAVYMPYLSDKGKDRKVERLTNLATLLDEKGYPNFKKHGQAIYNVVNWLRGGGLVYGMRLTADDATYANTILNVKTKAVQLPVYQKNEKGDYLKDASGNRIPELEDDTITPKMVAGVDIKLEVLKVSNLANKQLLKAQIEENLGKVDEDGYKNHPIYALTVAGRGEYGDNYSYRLSLNTSLEDTYDFRLYDLTVLERTKNGSLRIVDGPYTVSLFPEAVSIAGTSLFAGQVIKDNFKGVEMEFSDAAYDMLIDSIMEATKDVVTSEYTVDPQYIDILFGRNKKGELEEVISFENNTLAIDHFEGIVLEGGSDGAFSMKSSPKDRAAAIEMAYIEAYSGVTDASILNKKQYPVDIALDANFSIAIKEAISQFCKERKDVFGVLDTGILPAPSAAVAWRSNAFQESSYYTGIFGQSFSIYDSFTSMDIPVTSTYFLAQKIPFNDRENGIQFPFVGPSRGLVSGFKSLDWNPNEYEKNDLYKARVNYVEQDFQNTKFMSQLSSQFKTSSLSNINNVRILMRMIRDVEALSENYQFEYPSEDTLNSFNQNISNILSVWVNNGSCSSANGSAYQTAQDKELKIARVRIDVVFNNVIERIMIEFNVGK